MTEPVTEFRFETRQVHAGSNRSEDGVEGNVPIYASTSFVFNDSAHGAAIFGMTADAFCYSRLGNPTVDVFEKRIAALEGGIGALAASSGQAALFMAMTALATSGSNIVVASHTCDATATLLKFRLPPMGIQARFVNNGNLEDIRQKIDKDTKAVFLESVSVLGLQVSDIEPISKLAREAGVPLVVDNTAGAGGFLVRPIDHGADIVVTSAAEWLSISGSSVAGAIIDTGRFDWQKHHARFPQFTDPSPGFHGLKMWEKFGNLSFIRFARIAVLRDIGPCLNPFAAFELIAGLETLSVRVERHSSNALALATWLEKHEKISSVLYPGLPSNPSYHLGGKYLHNGHGGLLSFQFKGQNASLSSILQDLKVVSKGSSIGGSRTTMIFPTLASQQDFEIVQRSETDKLEGSAYISVGLEHIDDIISDLSKALAKI